MRNVLCLFALIVILASCSQPKPLVYKEVKQFEVKHLALNKSTVVIGVEYFNPNNYEIRLKDGDIDVFLNDKVLGKAKLDEKIVLAANANTIIPVTIDVDMQQILGNALQFLFNDEVTIRIKGSVKAGRKIFIRIPVDHITKQRIPIK